MIPLAVLILYSQAWMTDWKYDTNSDWYLVTSYRWNVFTKYFPVDNCVIYNMLNVWGYFYVTWVNLNSSKPWESHYDCHRWTLLYVLVISNTVFFLVVQYTMRAPA